MRYFIFLFALLLIFNLKSYSQTKAVITESGKQVELFDDGTWKYVFDDPSGSIKIDTIILTKPKLSDFLLKSTKLKYGVWVNKTKWDFSKNEKVGGTPTEYNFRLKNEDAYGVIIAEKVEIPIDNLLDIAFQNAQSASSDIQLVKKECRKVNGKYIYFMQMEGTMKGIKFVYLGYYYSDSNGSIQFLTYTSQNLMKQYKKEMEALLNGFVIIE